MMALFAAFRVVIDDIGTIVAFCLVDKKESQLLDSTEVIIFHCNGVVINL